MLNDPAARSTILLLTLSNQMQRMFRSNAMIRCLCAAETRPGIAMLCSACASRFRFVAYAFVALAAAACANGTAPVKGMCPAEPGQPAEIVYVVAHGWHAGIVVPRDRQPVLAWPVAADFPDAEYLEVGWGDKDFYMSREPDSGMALKAALGATATVLHVAGFRGAVHDEFPNSEIVPIRLSSPAFARLSGYVADSFAVDASGSTAALKDGLYGGGRFYPSRDTYSLFNTCNVWTAKALRSAGCPVTPAASITLGSLLRQLRAVAAQPRLGGRRRRRGDGRRAVGHHR